MKRTGVLLALVAGLIGFNASGFGSTDIVITDFNVTGNQGVLSWSGGRPAYQVQSRFDIKASWTNIGAPTTNTFAMGPVDENRPYFRVVSDFMAQYQVGFDASWSQSTHPTNCPGN